MKVIKNVVVTVLLFLLSPLLISALSTTTLTEEQYEVEDRKSAYKKQRILVPVRTLLAKMPQCKIVASLYEYLLLKFYSYPKIVSSATSVLTKP